MTNIIKLYLISLFIFFALDMIWLSLISKKFYQHQIGFLMKTNINIAAVILFYLIFILGLVIFVIEPSILKHSILNALILGLLFGLVTYATYDLTNLATIKNWPTIVTVIDLLWGSAASAAVSVATYYIWNNFFV